MKPFLSIGWKLIERIDVKRYGGCVKNGLVKLAISLVLAIRLDVLSVRCE